MLLSYNDLVLLTGITGVVSLVAGLILGLAVAHRAPEQPEPDDRHCSAGCALAALPRDRVVVIRHPRSGQRRLPQAVAPPPLEERPAPPPPPRPVIRRAGTSGPRT